MSIAAYKGVCPTCRHDHSAPITALASGSGDHAELARLAEAATRGPWVSEHSVDEWGVSVIASNETGHISNPTRGQVCHVSVVAGASGDDPDLAQANAAFIAAANPATVLALLAEIAALRAACDNANGHWKKTQAAWSEVLEATGCKDGGELVDRATRATEAERKLAEAVGLNERAAELMRQCTDPERFEGASTLNVYANMRAWLSDLSKEAERG